MRLISLLTLAGVRTQDPTPILLVEGAGIRIQQLFLDSLFFVECSLKALSCLLCDTCCLRTLVSVKLLV